MKACVLHAVGDLRYEDVAEPQPGPGEVRVRVAACGVCGSDLPRIFTKGTYHFPTIPGHEFAGTVDAVGEGVDGDLIGRVAAVFPLLPCRACAMCAEEHYALCENYGYLGSRSDGAFAQWVCAPVWNLAFAPEGVTAEAAAMTEPAAVALHALKRGGIQNGDRVAIFGAGPIGALCALWARYVGAQSVAVVDIEPSKLERLRSLGFDALCDARSCDAPAWVADALGGHADLVVEATGVAGGAESALQSARGRGRAVLLGNPSGDMNLAQDAYWQILRRELDVVGTWNSEYTASPDDDWHETLRAMASGDFDVAGLISHRIALDALPAFLEGLRSGRADACKVLVGGLE